MKKTQELKEDLKKNILLNSDKIIGNIGSCSTTTTKIQTKTGILISDYKTIATNSCTGITQEFNIWQINNSVVPIILSLLLLTLASFIVRAIIKEN